MKNSFTMKTKTISMSKFIAIACLTVAMAGSCKAQSGPLDLGKQIPDFTLQDQDGKTFNMSDSIMNGTYVIFFYPKDESFICTKEAEAFRDSMQLLKKAGVQVVGINKGTIESHKKFKQDDSLNFELLSDPDEAVMKKFGVKGGLFSSRVTFVVDNTGQIVCRCTSTTDGKEHVREVMQYVRAIQKNQKKQKANQ